MRRARKSLPLPLRGFRHNVQTGFYEIEQQGITYHLTFTQFNDVKRFFGVSGETDFNLSRWYNRLDRFTKKEVKRSGDIYIEHDGFYPDE